MNDQSPAVSASKLRRTHNKSRLGCKECKRRHVKCDEGRPHCVNCSVSNRRCEYAGTAAVRDQSLPSSPTPQRPYADRATSLPACASGLPHAGRAGVHDLDETFTLQHMQLLHHVEHGVTTWLGATEFLAPLVQQYIETALTTPYLMSQLLALAALHLSYDTAHESGRYRTLATELQTRGLSSFNLIKDNSDATARWYFSSLVAMHVLATTLATDERQDFDVFLDKLINHMGFHRGTQLLSDNSWDAIRNSGLRDWLDTEHIASSRVTSPASGQQSTFMLMLESSHLNAASVAACQRAAGSLEYLRERLYGHNSWGPHAAMAWPNLIPEDFVSLLKNRVPEALMILTHYAEMLHECSNFWVFGNAGEYLIRGLSARLGTSWNQWLAGPMAAIGVNSPNENQVI